ncbi:hypothetical protein [Acetobacter indonesiensis]|uniref:hypothetical protein n=1 Tax=Acetobacter indonesiensis TaxID=104101 RepID=UPI0039EC09AF
MKITIFAAALAAFFVSAPSFAQRQFVPPGGLPSNTPIGTAGDTFQSMLAQQAANADALAKTAQKAWIGQPTQADGTPGIAAMDINGNVTAPINTSVARINGTNGLYFSDPHANSETGFGHRCYYGANQHEFGCSENASGSNTAFFENLSLTGFGGITVRGPDNHFSGGYSYEHGAFVWDPGEAWGDDVGFMLEEISNYNQAFDAHIPPPPFILAHTGGEFTSYTEGYATLTAGSNLAICNGGCTWPTGITGYVIDTPIDFGRLPIGTTITGGDGTNTLTLSNAAITSTTDSSYLHAGTFVRFGPTVYQQYDPLVMSPMGGLGFFKYTDMHGGKPTSYPAFWADLNSGHVGIGTNQPVGALDVNGKIYGGALAADRTNMQGVFNASVSPGSESNSSSVIEDTMGEGANLVRRYWGSDGKIHTYDVGHSMDIMTQDMTGTGATRIPYRPETEISADYTLTTSDCGTTVLPVGDTTAITVTVPSGLPVGCQVKMLQIGKAATTIHGDGTMLNGQSGVDVSVTAAWTSAMIEIARKANGITYAIAK